MIPINSRRHSSTLLTLGADVDIVFLKSRVDPEEDDNNYSTTWAGKYDEYSIKDSDTKESKSNLSEEALRITMTHGCILVLPEVEYKVRLQ